MKTKKTVGIVIQKIITWFLRGLLISMPLVLTAYLLFLIFKGLDGLFQFEHAGVGLLLILAGILIIGIFGSSLITRPIISLLETILEKTPGIKLIYSSIKDLMEAFVGEKKKFNKPVLIQTEGEGIYKIGFVTNESFSKIKEEGYSAVYIPFSYTFTGHLYIVHTSKIKPVEGNPADWMKFVASGGVTQL
jgi:uncharacterized membrane protein